MGYFSFPSLKRSNQIRILPSVRALGGKCAASRYTKGIVPNLKSRDIQSIFLSSRRSPSDVGWRRIPEALRTTHFGTLCAPHLCV